MSVDCRREDLINDLFFRKSKRHSMSFGIAEAQLHLLPRMPYPIQN
jgi:hypothetical protein